MIRYLITFVFCLFLISIGFTQSIKLEGKILDTLNIPLKYANIIAEPEDNLPLKFAISDEEGHYELLLEKEKLYNITVSYLGYIPQSISYKIRESAKKNFILKRHLENLDEIVIKYTPPLIIKEDTITYQVNAFTTGKERKLRDILKNLPAIEVDREGNVTVYGKKVNKVLVENKQFFTGNSKLAVNNIPADAVEKIEVLDNYNEVDFLKGLEDSDDMAMNIKLKENKKRFVFGDIEAVGGIKKRYLIHPSLYYYSPKTSMNTIGDFNNTGNKSFTIKDYLEFEGGTNKLINDSKGYFSLLNDDFAQFLTSKDFSTSFNQFGALSINQALNSKTDLSSYGIWSGLRNETKTQNLNDYIINNNLIENRTEIGQQKSRFGIGKLTLKLKPNNDTDLTFENYVKFSSSNFKNNILTISKVGSNNINTFNKADNVSIKQSIQWHRQFNKKHTTSIIFNYQYQKATPNINWLTDKPILQDLVPIVEEDNYNINKNKETELHDSNLILKHYWVLNRFNHLNFSFGSQLTFEDYLTREYQILDDLSINDFTSFGYSNDLKFRFNDLYFGMHYKFSVGQVTFKPGIFYHNYLWSINNLNDKLKRNKLVLLPDFTISFKSNLKNRITIIYATKSKFPQISLFANRLTLISFNQIFRGNQNLYNEQYHYISFNMNRFSLYKDIFYNLTASYQVKKDNIKNTTTIEGIDFVSSPVLSNFEDNVWTINGNLKKGVGKYKFSIKGTISLIDYETPINTEIVANTSNNFSLGGGFETRFKNFPNFDIDYTKSISKYKAKTSSDFQADVISTSVEYAFLKNFIFKADYRFENYENKTFNAISTFDVANISLLYQKEDSPWKFEISSNNIFDIGFKQRNSFSSILVSDQKTFILPRIILFKILYKL